MTTTRTETPSKMSLPSVLAGLIALCLVAGAALTALTHGSAPVAAPAEQMSLVVQRIPFEAQNALRGDATAFDALAKSMAVLKTLRAGVQGGADAATWGKLSDAVTVVADARPAVETIQASSREVRELAPKLLSELGDLGSSVGG